MMNTKLLKMIVIFVIYKIAKHAQLKILMLIIYYQNVNLVKADTIYFLQIYAYYTKKLIIIV